MNKEYCIALIACCLLNSALANSCFPCICGRHAPIMLCHGRQIKQFPSQIGTEVRKMKHIFCNNKKINITINFLFISDSYELGGNSY